MSLETQSAAIPFVIPQNRWRPEEAAGKSPGELLLYRSNLLGADLTVTNFGGGNTSAKLTETDPLTGDTVDVLWVKGSGGDIGSMKLDGFATLYMDKLLALEKLYRGVEHEDEMVDYLPHCTFNLNARAASIDTPLHAYLPFAHVDHVHPDALIALAASSEGEKVTREIWGGRIGWLPWKRPGFELGLRLRNYVAANPACQGIMLAGHGIICWGDSAEDCYRRTIGLIADAGRYFNDRLATEPAFGGQITAPAEDRRAIAARLMPRLRGLFLIAHNGPFGLCASPGVWGKIGHFSDDAETLEFVCSARLEPLAAIGTSCPDHFLRTKIAPLALDSARLDDEAYLAAAINQYREGYAAYYQRHADAQSPAMRDANPVVVLIPAIGRITFAGDKTTARLASEFYGNAINVMRGAEVIGSYRGLEEREAFNIEYWALEEAKLQRLPKPKPMVGKIALVTGGAGGIGAATARRLLAEGACVMLLDRDAEALGQTAKAMAKSFGTFGKDVVRHALCNVTNENQVQAAFEQTAREFGGLDILVANAGIASSAPIERTTVELWRRNFDVLAEGYFLAARAAFPLLRAAGGGSIVFIGSKNAVAATTNASAYASAKAASVHLARCLALEGAPFGIRVNVVNPDAVIKGSRIWDGDWRRERADAYGIDPGKELEDHYRNRSMLKREVLPEDIAEAVYFFASDQSAKLTGNMINVDAGNAGSFTR